MKCECKDCGKIFYKGEEGDNEKYCLQCEIESTPDSDDDYCATERDIYEF